MLETQATIRRRSLKIAIVCCFGLEGRPSWPVESSLLPLRAGANRGVVAHKAAFTFYSLTYRYSPTNVIVISNNIFDLFSAARLFASQTVYTAVEVSEYKISQKEVFYDMGWCIAAKNAPSIYEGHFNLRLGMGFRHQFK